MNYTIEELAAIYPNILQEQDIPFLLDTDSYKLSHPKSYSPAKRRSAYFTFRKPLDYVDQRINFIGMRYMYEHLLTRKITWQDIAQADAYTAKHSAGGQQFEWPRDMWISVINDLDGYIPIRILSLRDGETIYARTPAFIIQAEEPYERIVTWFETALMRIWSPSTVATRAAVIRTIIQDYYDKTVDDNEMWRINYAMQDFGSRGVSSAETAMTAGMGYLSVFDGTDNIISALLCSRYNDGVPVGQSVIASEHSVMTDWPDEDTAIDHLISITPAGGILSCVADTYDYDNFIWNVIPRHIAAIRAKNIFFVVRPDSGDPVKCVTDGLAALDTAFGHRLNSKNYKVLNGAAILQGDGIDQEMLERIHEAIYHLGWSAQNLIVGMGGGLLQKINRDSMAVAIKLCETVLLDNTVHDIMKIPKDDTSKSSLAGMMQVNLVDNIPTVYPANATWEDHRIETNMLEEIYNRGPVGYIFENWTEIRARHLRTWNSRPMKADPISTQMKEKSARIATDIRARIG